MQNDNVFDRRVLLAGLGAAGALAASRALHAGDLHPPPGPVGPTMKPLDEVEPRTPINAVNTPGDSESVYNITQSGSYYLTENLIGEPGKHGIRILAPRVTIDLNGFALIGRSDALSGILGTSVQIAIRNGFCSGWGGSGIDTTPANGVMIDRVQSRQNGAAGIRAGASALVRDCIAVNNAADGIAAGNRSIIECCVANGNTGVGINALDTSIVRVCNVYSNNGNGIRIRAFGRCVDNVCDFNRDSTSPSAGILVNGSSSQIERNQCTDNNIGIHVMAGNCFIARNICRANVLNWQVAANNKCLVVSGVNAGAFSGNSGGVSPGSTDPNANYTY